MELTRDYLTLECAATLFGYRRQALAYPIKLGLLRFLQVGRRVLVSRTSLMRYMEGGAGGRPRGPADRSRRLPLLDA